MVRLEIATYVVLCTPICLISGPDPNIIICGEEEDEDSQDAMVEALQEMCGTVGKLSKQIKELMCKINKMT